MGPMSIHAFSIDVEEWYHAYVVRSALKTDAHNLKSRLEFQLNLWLDFLDGQSIKSTFFWLAPLAKSHSNLVALCHDRGHEVASHGWYHKHLNQLNDRELRIEVSDSKILLEQITGNEVRGYRAPNFSITQKALNQVIDAGYRFDSSWTPTRFHSGYGSLDFQTKNEPFPLDNAFWELPLSTGPFGIPCAGGAYVRHFPTVLSKLLWKWSASKGPLNVYFHTWEMDGDQPLPKQMSRLSRFRHMGSSQRLFEKIDVLTCDYRFVSCNDLIDYYVSK